MSTPPSPELPATYQDILSRARVCELFSDVELASELIEVKIRHQGARRAEEGSTALTEARGLLLDGKVGGVQLRYRHAGQVWFDTLMPRGEDRYLLVRVGHTTSPT